MYEQPYQGSRFLGLSINNNYPMSERYLSSAHTVYRNALNSYSKILMFHVTLRLPLNFQGSTIGLMTSFTTALKRRVKRNLDKRRAQVVRVHSTDVHYVWCREVSSEQREHFHVMVMVNANTYRALGDYSSFAPHYLAGMVNGAWASALNLDSQQSKGLAHFSDVPALIETKRIPFSCGYSSYGHFSDDYEAGFYWLSYLCKIATKEYGDGFRNFGYSS
ncbi:inovirus Gp2 family protein [Vibrio vulnificus]|nr:inovirus Gp2 family protein [Vibrio vulnificus]ELH9432724.1 inovirus Gp2 family protein [Vibrio vulnificus]